jgi:hypothetical protein
MLEHHLRVPREQMCQVGERREPMGSAGTQYRDPEDGITAGIDSLLRDRRKGYQIMDWNRLWKAMFPADLDDQIPSHGRLTVIARSIRLLGLTNYAQPRFYRPSSCRTSRDILVHQGRDERLGSKP